MLKPENNIFILYSYDSVSYSWLVVECICLADQTLNPEWPQTEGWHSRYLKVAFNSAGSRASLRPPLTESTQRSAALQVVNTLLTVVRGLLSSEQRTASWKHRIQTNCSRRIWSTKGLVSWSAAISQGNTQQTLPLCVECEVQRWKVTVTTISFSTAYFHFGWLCTSTSRISEFNIVLFLHQCIYLVAAVPGSFAGFDFTFPTHIVFLVCSLFNILSFLSSPIQSVYMRTQNRVKPSNLVKAETHLLSNPAYMWLVGNLISPWTKWSDVIIQRVSRHHQACVNWGIGGTNIMKLLMCSLM